VQPEAGERHRCRRQLGRAVAGGAEAELEEVDALPAHRDLDDPVQLTQARRGGRQQAAPDHRAELEQPDLQLESRADARACGIGRFVRQRRPRRAVTPGCYRPSPPAAIKRPRFLMLYEFGRPEYGRAA